ncbi:MAG TPA: N,N-dimethylformamidase beta subunit family domain-containing protein, partial [Thermoanaerobaculia bacterium]|nr:N,N-dimethylformamidase beta subunit family domain-containing protein [Thermoanaerobaculia bacterium]
GGYADRTSVAQGDTIRFHIASNAAPLSVSILNLANRGQVVRTMTGLQSRAQNCSGQFTTGCGWTETASLTIPRSWPSGYYAATFNTSLGERNIIFVVREDAPGSTSRTLIVSPTNTYVAHNAFGGASLYPDDSPRRGSRVSFDRPYDLHNGLGRFEIWERRLVDWMTNQNMPYEVATDDDMDDPALLANYNVVVLPGHSQYWTAEARANLERFSAEGGHIAIFGASTMLWHVRLEDDGRTLVGLKDPDRYDPVAESNPHLATVRWAGEPLNRPENRITGASFRHGGYANRVNDPLSYDMLPLHERKGFVVTEPDHWVFAGTNVGRGTTFGQEVTGLEVDGALYNCSVNGELITEGSDGTPLNYHILAVTPASEGHGTMGIYVNPSGGAVFNAATQHWLVGLEGSAIVQAVTRNVLDRFSTGVPLVYDPVDTPLLAQELFNCPNESKVYLPGWLTNQKEGQATLSARCGFEGPAGLELSGDKDIVLRRVFSPFTDPRNHIEGRFHVKADDWRHHSPDAMPLLTLQRRQGGSMVQAAHVEVWTDANGMNKIRLARRDAAGNFFASDWIDLANGWHLVEFGWRSPGTLTLRLDGGPTRTMENPVSGQTVHEVVIAHMPRVENAGTLCVDALAVQ